MRTLASLMIAATCVLVATANAAGPPSRAQYNYYDSQASSRSSGYYYVTPSPRMVAPAAGVAAQPVERRALSVEPQTPQPMIATQPGRAQGEVRRSFSYEPTMAAPVTTYSRVRTSKPQWMLMKSDPAKFR